MSQDNLSSSLNTPSPPDSPQLPSGAPRGRDEMSMRMSTFEASPPSSGKIYCFKSCFALNFAGFDLSLLPHVASAGSFDQSTKSKPAEARYVKRAVILQLREELPAAQLSSPTTTCSCCLHLQGKLCGSCLVKLNQLILASGSCPFRVLPHQF